MSGEKYFYIFKNNFDDYKQWKLKFPLLQAIWYDGQSSILKGLSEVFEIEFLIVEDSIETNAFKYLDRDKIKSINRIATKRNASGNNQICLFPSNDTHVHSFKNILKDNNSFDIFVSKYKHERAEDALEALGISYNEIKFNKSFIKKYSGLLVGNDWGWIESYFIEAFKSFSIPTFCLQESVLNFEKGSGRMQKCDFPLIQGIATIKTLKRDIYLLTGNPRYEMLEIEKSINNNLVAINSNFTYGIHEDIQMDWINTIIDTCKSLKLEYIILQHPRDNADLSRFNSVKTSAKTIHDHLRESTLLISRFSSIIHESLAIGRPVVYYNPHKENMYYDYEHDQKYLIMAKNEKELNGALKSLLNENNEEEKMQFFRDYIQRHLGTHDRNAGKRVVQAIDHFTANNAIKNDFISKWHYANLYRRYLKSVISKKIRS